MSAQQSLKCGNRTLDLSIPQVMGVLNVTPDSFSDGGRFSRPEAALQQACLMQQAGAAIIDVGGESTRPGATPVSDQQQLDRIMPVIERLSAELDIIISVDTSSPVVMTEAGYAGAGMINDVRALTRLGALKAARESGLPVCLMHMQGEPADMQLMPAYSNVVIEVRDYLQSRIKVAIEAGIPRELLLIDPGFGFGKTLSHNLNLLRNLQLLTPLAPVLVGVSRKSMIGKILDRPVDQRLAGGLALAVMAAERGACVIRTHDVAETRDALRMLHAVLSESTVND